ncbi:tail fiber protein [Vibrio phage VPT02]|nr:tail fiber protein [Vibrio phage VPT02]
MIENTLPRKLVLGTIAPGYTKLYIPHSSYEDKDVVGKAFWIDGTRFIDTNIDVLYTIVDNLKDNTEYKIIEGSYYDAMVDSELLDSKLGINMSEASSAKTLEYPSIHNVIVGAQEVDIGVGDPIITMDIQGDAQSIRIDKKLSSEDDTHWQPCYSGAPDAVSFTTGQGTYDFRVIGFIYMPDGVTTESSPYSTIKNVKVENMFRPPSAPENINFKVAKIMDGIERYDLQVSWDWDKGTGSSVREFVLYFVETSEYNKTQWRKASKINSGAAKASVITSFPFNKEYKFKVAAIAWGPADQALTDSNTASFKITSSTPLDSSFANETGIEVTYDHIKAYRDLAGRKEQTFRLDAKTGSLAIGKLDAQGKAPISVDPLSGNVNVDGAVISKTMYSASFVLSNLSGKDNPSIRTASKTGYGQSAQGMWMGYTNNDQKFKFDLGDSTKFIRWDGEKLLISGKVQIGTPGGNVDIDQGIQGNFVANIYKDAATQPSAPSGNDYPPAGWSDTPITNPQDLVWISTAVIDSKSNKVASNSAWSTPIQFTAKAGEDGVATVLIYRASTNQPTTPTNKSIPPAGWLTEPPARSVGQSIWVCSAERKGIEPNITGNWSEPAKFSGDQGDQGIPGKDGSDGRTFYTWIKYADTVTGSGISNSPTGKRYIGIASNMASSTESNDPSDYTWALMKGDQGIPGTNGKDGKTTYTWIKYADDSSGRGFTDDPTGKAYLGIATNKATQQESTDWRDYNWSKIKGEKGDTGVPGRNGKDGKTYYTWVRYADTAQGIGMSDSPDGKKYIGIAVNQLSPTESTNPNVYTWSKFEGDQGVPGRPGADGVTYYTWIKYADSADGSGISNSPSGKEYIGFAYNKTSAVESSNPADYTWSRIKGDKGDKGDPGRDGIPGAPGKDGVTTYTWIRYADTATGGGMSNTSAGKKYIGIAVNKTTPTESSNPTDYSWSKLEGDQGVPGKPGKDGKTYYTWIKYADNASGSGMSNSPSGKKYIGFAYNKTTPTESSRPQDYVWSKFAGDDGRPGRDGQDGEDGQDGRPGRDGKDGRPGRDGRPGSDGSRGPGFYAQPISRFSRFNTTSATKFFTDTFGKGPVEYDVLTQFNPSNPASAETRQWIKGSWQSAAMLVHGNMIVNGSITAQKIIASNAFLQQIGVNVIYDNAAAQSSNPESRYKMKIDLSRGSIHIR